MASREPIVYQENIRTIDSGIRMLQTGDIVLRTGKDITSYLLAQVNPKEKVYSHCGIVSVEDGYPFVYHSIGGEDNPNQQLKRDSAAFWFSPRNNLGFAIVRYNLTDSGRKSLLRIARQMYLEGRIFDMDFDLKSEYRLYCTEFVCKALWRATGDSSELKPYKIFGYTYVSPDLLYQSPGARVICRVRYK